MKMQVRGKRDANQRKSCTGVPELPDFTAYMEAISDRAQENTIAFDALGFLTGTLGSDSFFPPGKVADFWGFQYLRDNDPSQMGHAGDFLTSAAMNTLNNLTAEQRAELRRRLADFRANPDEPTVTLADIRRELKQGEGSGPKASGSV